MDIVPYSGTVRRIVVIAEHIQMIQLAHCHLGNVGHQVIGDTVGSLADQPGLVCADWIEVTQQHHVPWVGVAVLRIRCMQIGKDLLQHGFGLAIRIRAAAFGTGLRNGDYRRVAIDRGRGGKDNVLAVVTAHNIHQHQRTANIVVIVLPGFQHRFTYRF